MAPKTEENDIINKLITGCINNERSAQKELYKQCYAFSIGICLRYARNKTDAEIILNEAFYKVFKHIKRFDLSKSFHAWLTTILTNTAIDHYRTALKFGHAAYPEEYDIALPDSTIYDKLQYQDLLSMIQKLSPAYRTVFNLYAIEGYSHEEIGAMLNISVGSSKSNLFKARSKLMEMLHIENNRHRNNGKLDGNIIE